MSSESEVVEPKKRRTRIEPEMRRKAIIEATMQCITRYGHSGSTLERICAQAGVSIGLIGHHFSSKEELMLSTYQELTDQLREETRKFMATQGGTSEDRLLAIIRSSFRGQIFNEFTLTTWLGFWGAAVSSDQLRELNKKLYADYRKELEAVFKAIAKDNGTKIDAKGAALTITALIDGFWLEWALDHQAFSSKRAEKCCITTALMFVNSAEPLAG
ncbi:transcriptional regulator BetI [Pseudomonas vancouverensis]|uniref:Transcriptional regulator BetI n=1 Tax=Pseudomonas vancouverensis TaxID=95300 RepID=A0A1H2NQ37_PSEVA|nr:transcriptional regulator BetI [Pseudomonas vancouverensis]KAB0491266.1 transcriptional regulator BetI [Pseudomonas vancouverensis]TDB64299.1 transcriptional regulator BetI [Pseudomonas vancouverensis]SDV07494.1 transcriptional regulator, TetR family [Pseudomonas vancouverensis]